MATFAELLTEFMVRTGIGDAELARRVQVNRLTLIRWKEGVTSRPRHREDVVRCAEVLRLTPDETDALLLAAGFAPDSVSGVAREEGSADPSDSDAPAEAAPESTARRERPLHRRLSVQITALVLLAVALAVGVAVAFESQERPPDHPVAIAGEPQERPPDHPVTIEGESQERPPDHPVATDGESLIVLAPFSNYTGGQQGFNIRGRLREEIDREVLEAGLLGVRTAEWPRVIAAEPDAIDAGVRSRASMVIWGEYDSGRVMASFTVPPLSQAQGSYGPQVVDISSSPAELPTAINLDLTGEVRSVALMTLGQLYLEQGEHDLAKAALAQALTREPIDAATLAGLRFRLGRAYLGGKYADLDEAVWLFTQVLAVQPRSVDTLNNRALAYLDRGRDGDAALAVEDLSRAIRFDPLRAGAYLNRAVAYLEYDDGAHLERAIADLQQAIEIDPSYSAAYVNRASAYLQRGGGGDIERAFDDIETALSLDSGLAAAYVNRGNAYLQRGDPGDLERAAEEFSRAIDFEPDSATAYYNRGLVLSALLTTPEDWAGSTDDLKRAQELEPGDFAFNNTLCWQLTVHNQAEQALPFCEAALWERSEGIALDTRGLAFAVMGRTSEAVADFESFLAWVDASQKDTCRSNYGPSRRAWVVGLKTGDNPFDSATLQDLRVRPVAPSVTDPC